MPSTGYNISVTVNTLFQKRMGEFEKQARLKI